MNLINHVVLEVYSKPVRKECDRHIWWEVEVLAESWGRSSCTKLVFPDEESASRVQTCFTFDA